MGEPARQRLATTTGVPGDGEKSKRGVIRARGMRAWLEARSTGPICLPVTLVVLRIIRRPSVPVGSASRPGMPKPSRVLFFLFSSRASVKK